ncbi:MAG: cytochrome P450 [Gammaproteobacteria bacterium]|nr:cytochrome P450 [Gammaproteobacteria bacterium]
MAENYDHLRERARSVSGKSGRVRQRIAVDPSFDPWSVPLDELNVANPEIFRQELWPKYFKRLRDEAPVHYTADSQYGAYWSITRFEDIMEVDKRHDVFSSDFTMGGITIHGRPTSMQELPMFIQMDPPKHDAQRMTVAPMFTQRSLAELEAVIRERAGNILDALPRNTEFDWVPEVSVELTSRMLATLFDVPQEDRKTLIRWSNIVSNADDPDYITDAAQFWEAMAECGEYFAHMWQSKKSAEPRFDLLSMLSHSPATADMDRRELLGNVILLLVGGNDTTRNSISGGVHALNEFPDEFAKLRANPALVHSMVPEIIRWQTPLMHMRRTVMQDVDFRGHALKRGDKVVMWYLSGNRDERVIDDPDRFIIDRKDPRHHLSFGFGIHRCLGNRLAEIQVRVLWEEILKRFSRVEVRAEPVRASSSLFRAIQSMLVAVSA